MNFEGLKIFEEKQNWEIYRHRFGHKEPAMCAQFRIFEFESFLSERVLAIN